MSTTENSRRNPLLVYLILEGASSLLFQLVVTIYVVYYATTVGLDPFRIVLIGSMFEAAIFLFEIPTGIVADLYSRKLSIIVGLVLIGLGMVIEGLFPVFGVILLAEIVSGIGVTFISGATQAWITDEIGVERAGKAFLIAAQVRTVASIVGSILSVMLASIALNLPFIVAGTLLVVLAAFLIFFMPETGFRRAEAFERSTWQTMVGTFREGLSLITLRRVLIPIFVIEFVFAFHSEGFDHLWQNHILDNFTLPVLGTFQPVVWFGIISIGANVFSILLNEIVRRRVNLSSHLATGRALGIVYGITSVGILIFALAGDFVLALVAYWLVMALRGTGKPISDAWLNQNLDPKIRATMFSMNGQINAIGEIIGGPPVGFIGSRFSLRAALFTSGLVLALTLPMFAAVLRRKIVPEEQVTNL